MGGARSSMAKPVGKPLARLKIKKRASIAGADLPKVASNNREKATAKESEKIVRGSLAYFGTYTTNEAQKSFTVQIEGSTFPNWVGTSDTLSYAISGDELRIADPTASGGRPATVLLKRASQK